MRNTSVSFKPITNDIVNLYINEGIKSYGERVSQLEHALQAAELAENKNESPSLIVASLLHDIGHLQYSENLSEEEIDQYHEEIGANWLEQYFPKSVTEPVRLHVAAKRYLCAIDDSYWGSLSDASKHSLELQGGIMSSKEVLEFEKNPWAQNAANLRKFDDLAKLKDHKSPDIKHFAKYIDEML